MLSSKGTVVAFLSLLVCFLVVVFCQQQQQEDKLTIHLVPHSHCDPGWLTTVEEYYSEAVSHILNSVTENLIKHTDRRFIWVETSFFSLWWTRTSQLKRDQWRTLLDRGQVEFILGGWVMNDEATTTYTSNIDQMTHGHRFLRETFGSSRGIPKIGWDIDPFGLSQANARMYKDMNFKYHVINRIDYRLKKEMIEERSLEFNWKLRDKDSQILTHVLYEHYSSPMGFEWEGSLWNKVNYTKNPIITQDNVAERSQVLVEVAKRRAQSFRTNHLLVPFGDDFEFRNSYINFGNMSQLVDYINDHSDHFGVNIRYSLLSEYFESIDQSLSKDFPTFDSDFLPYADNEHSYWTGYYTSRPLLKYYARLGERMGRSSDILFALASNTHWKNEHFSNEYNQLSTLRTGNAYIQHHDGITGTEKLDVIQMYVDYIDEGLNNIKELVSSSLQKLLSLNKQSLTRVGFQLSASDFTDVRDQFVPIVIFNSLGWTRSELVIITTSTSSVSIQNSNGDSIPIDIIPLSNNRFEISFLAKQVPAICAVTYFLTRTTQTKFQKPVSSEVKQVGEFTISNSVYDIHFCSHSEQEQRICQIKNKLSGVSIQLDQNILHYQSMARKDEQNSGAYIFRSDGSNKYPVTNLIETTVANGLYSTQVHQQFTSYAKQTVRLFNSDHGDTSSTSAEHVIEIEYEIGQVPIDHEIVTLFQTDIESNNLLYTDNHGYFTQERVRREEVYEFDSANYYPTQLSTFIRDSKSQLTILPSQSRGVASLKSGQVEFMLHRRTSRDDGRGLDLALNDTTTVVVTLRLIVDTPERSTQLRHIQSQLLNYPLDTITVDYNSNNWTELNIHNRYDYNQYFTSVYKAVNYDLPSAVHLQTLQSHSSNDSSLVLFRLYNMFEEWEQNDVQVVHVDNWLHNIKIKSQRETYLSGNQPLAVEITESSSLSVTLKPNQIRTFELKLN